MGAAHHAAGSAQAAQGAADHVKQMVEALDTQAQAVVMAVSAASALADEVRRTAEATQQQQQTIAAFQEAANAMREMTQTMADAMRGMAETMRDAVAEMKAPRTVTIQRGANGELVGARTEEGK